jgi:dTDP-4-dehydrorhamnose reductase
MDRILITGASGLLGTHLSEFLRNSGLNVITHAFKSKADNNFDLSKKSDVLSALDEINPTIIINLAALTDVDKCEEDIQLCYSTNVRAVENLTEWINGKDCQLIHISTDQLYDNAVASKEDNIVMSNTYTFSKYASELAAHKVGATIIRTNFFGKSQTPNRDSFSDWITKALKDGQKINMFNDVLFNPVSIQTLCNCLKLIVEKPIGGVFNIGSKDPLSKKDFAMYLAELFSLDTSNINSITIEELNLKANRPKNMIMDVSKFEETYSIELPSLKDEIASLRNGK